MHERKRRGSLRPGDLELTSKAVSFHMSQVNATGVRLPSETSQLLGMMAPRGFMSKNSNQITGRKVTFGKISVPVSMACERMENFPSLDGKKITYVSAGQSTGSFGSFLSQSIMPNPVNSLFTYGLPKVKLRKINFLGINSTFIDFKNSGRGKLDGYNPFFYLNYFNLAILTGLEYGLKVTASTLTQVGRTLWKETKESYEETKKGGVWNRIKNACKTVLWGAATLIAGLPTWLIAQPLFLAGNTCSYTAGLCDGLYNLSVTAMDSIVRKANKKTKYAGWGTCFKAIGKNGLKLTVTGGIIAASFFVPVLPAVSGFFGPKLAALSTGSLSANTLGNAAIVSIPAVGAQIANSFVDASVETMIRPNRWERFKSWLGIGKKRNSLSTSSAPVMDRPSSVPVFRKMPTVRTNTAPSATVRPSTASTTQKKLSTSQTSVPSRKSTDGSFSTPAFSRTPSVAESGELQRTNSISKSEPLLTSVVDVQEITPELLGAPDYVPPKVRPEPTGVTKQGLFSQPSPTAVIKPAPKRKSFSIAFDPNARKQREKRRFTIQIDTTKAPKAKGNAA